MPHYTLCCFESFKLVLCERFDAPDDKAALAESIRLHDGRVAELWSDEDHRKVRQFEKAEQPKRD